LLRFLLFLAQTQTADLIYDADIGAIGDREPRLTATAADTYAAIMAQLPSMFAEWASEPPKIQYVLAGLAAITPGVGAAIQNEVNGFGARLGETREGRRTPDSR
jgi:hypothetical protein